MICIYHSRDLDGFTSGAIVKRKYPDAEMYGYDYGEPLPTVPANEPIIMIDVSLPMKEMFDLAKHSGWQLTWIDHHISAINEYREFVGEGETFMIAILEDGIAACEGGWKHLFPDEEMPRAVKLLGQYDTWRNADKERWENEILPFQFGIRILCNSPESFPTSLFGDTDTPKGKDVDSIIDKGKTVLEFQAQVNELQCRKERPRTLQPGRPVPRYAAGSSRVAGRRYHGASVWY